MNYTIFDIETDGLLNNITTLHCLSYQRFKNNKFFDKGTLFNKKEIEKFILEQDILVGHNIIGYDLPVLEKLYNIVIPNNIKIIDTLGISYYLYPQNSKHGLEFWGDHYKVPKPIIKDWKNLKIKDYVHRCETDVIINTTLFHDILGYLYELYDNNNSKVFRIINYLNFKLECLFDQYQEKIKLDIYKAKKHFENLNFEIEEITKNIAIKMPRITVKKKPKKMYKKDGNLSKIGETWIESLKKLELPLDTEEIKELGNPGSVSQLKNWLFSLGWNPITFKVSKATGKKVPQVSKPFSSGLCDSVIELSNQIPDLKSITKLYKAKHRRGIFKSFLEQVDNNGYIISSAHGFTNTLRLKHSKPIVNLPGVYSFYGKEIRECLTIPNENYIMYGADISGLEDNTKQHFIYFFDPEYVKEMQTLGFDPHLDIGLRAGILTSEEVEFYKKIDNLPKDEISKEDSKRFKEIKNKRHISKTTNFSATYKAGPKKIAETAKKSLEVGIKMYETYWERNWAIKKVERSVIKKEIRNQYWIFNPISKFWIFLKNDKDIFSTLNQNSGVFVFDSWLREVRIELKKLKNKISLQYHDELLGVTLKENKEVVDKILKNSIDNVNIKLNLNITIRVSIEWGNNYAECH